MNNSEKVIEAILKVSSDTRPSSIDYNEIQQAKASANLTEQEFQEACKALENSGLIQLVYGSNELTTISLSRSFPVK